MRVTISLDGIWQLTYTEGLHGTVRDLVGVAVDEGRFFPAPVPCEVHEVLQRAGILPDLGVGCNTLSARWVEDQWWIYRRTFDVDAALAAAPAYLVFEGLDYQAIVYVNGQEVGRHANAHRPCRLDVSGRLHVGSNTLAVAVESGLDYGADRAGADYTPETFTYLTKRHWLRKGQYQAGWDTHCRLLNVGITGAVRLEVGDEPRLGTVTILAHVSDDNQRATVEARVTVDNPGPPCEGVLRARVRETGAEMLTHALLEHGESRLALTAEIQQPQLWWPRGHGPQTLYTLEVSLECAGTTVDRCERRTGIRRVRLQQDPHPDGGRYFTIEVNGRPIFCKGSDWQPPHMIPSSITHERLKTLVDMAVRANFNFLRVWGGGVFAGHDLLGLCDEAGLLVWHDFLFACTRYPSDDPAFLAELRSEITWATREYASHPSLAVWCGNNEQEWGAWEWGFDKTGKALPDYALYHHVIPVILAREDGTRPYWPSSPYSPDGREPNDPLAGDQHPWSVGMPQGFGTDFWAYRTFVDRFPDEGSVLAAPALGTLHQFLPDGERHLRSRSWIHHDNSFNYRQPTTPIAFQMVRDWLGLEPTAMTMDDYAVASGLVQAEALTEFIANYRRRMFSSAAAVFWVLADSWPMTHNFSIVDYYLRPKLSYHPIRRAFAPVTVVVAEQDDTISVFGVNDSPVEWTGALRYGVFTLRGDYPVDNCLPVSLPANRSVPLAHISRAAWEAADFRHSGAFAVLLADEQVLAQHRLFLARIKDLVFAKPRIAVDRQAGSLTLTSDVFVWRACLDVTGDEQVPDNAFDLFPGIPYRLPWPMDSDRVRVVCTGNGVVAGQPT